MTQTPADSPRETSPLLPTSIGTNGNSVDPGNAANSQYDDEEVQQYTEGIDDRHDPGIRKQVIWISPALGIGIFLSAIDQTIVASAYGEIGSDLKALNNTSWIATA
jgi:hypothetical protein